MVQEEEGGLNPVEFTGYFSAAAAALDSLVSSSLMLSISLSEKNTLRCITIITFSQAAVRPLSPARLSAAEQRPYL